MLQVVFSTGQNIQIAGIQAAGSLTLLSSRSGDNQAQLLSWLLIAPECKYRFFLTGGLLATHFLLLTTSIPVEHWQPEQAMTV